MSFFLSLFNLSIRTILEYSSDVWDNCGQSNSDRLETLQMEAARVIELNDAIPEEFEDTKGVTRIRKSKKNRQHNGQKKKYKRTNNNLQNIPIKLKIE